VALDISLRSYGQLVIPPPDNDALQVRTTCMGTLYKGVYTWMRLTMDACI